MSSTIDSQDRPVRLARLLTSLVAAVALYDACLWKVRVHGLSLPMFFFLLGIVILFTRTSFPHRRTTRGLLLLLAGALFAGVLETGAANGIVFVLLLSALAADSFFRHLPAPGLRWLSGFLSLFRAPFGLFCLGRELIKAASAQSLRKGTGIMSAFLLTWPALFLALPFGYLLASGNAVFRVWTGRFFAWLAGELALDFNLRRLGVWILVASIVLPLLRPSRIPTPVLCWFRRLFGPRVILPARRARLSSSLVLVVLNGLFLIANVADAIFLWDGGTLPAGVSFSRFVHEGTNALTLAALLSGAVLTLIFQQDFAGLRLDALKILSLVWIAQNLFLLLSVALRLKHYIEAYDMTVLRLSLFLFLLLVAAGYGLLATKIIRDLPLTWLLENGAVAAFIVLYLAQFFDLAGSSATYNLAQWEKNNGRPLDLEYLRRLGPAAWPALRRATEEGAYHSAPAQRQLDLCREEEAAQPRSQFDLAHWREFSLRAWLNRKALERK